MPNIVRDAPNKPGENVGKTQCTPTTCITSHLVEVKSKKKLQKFLLGSTYRELIILRAKGWCVQGKSLLSVPPRTLEDAVAAANDQTCLKIGDRKMKLEEKINSIYTN